MKKIGLLCASDTELAPFLPHIQSPVLSERAMLRFLDGTLCGLPVTALYSGVCKVNAAIAVQLLIDFYQVDAVINAGTAGGIDPSVGLFDTVAAERCIYHDVEEDILTDFHPWMPTAFFEADPGLLAAASACAADFARPVRLGTIVSGEQFVENEKRAELQKRFSPLAADMESAAAAHVCYVNRIPFLSVRTVTDTADHTGLVSFEQNLETASRVCADFVMEIAKHLL
ncbi:MAG: 5'-methylthioadenosine/S-adenosylhomocysteine nucleosidase [Eubacteriales bacterium]|nr:5'-methylthioadenosine/S-adenosylhomocysteine nucleosidase [Eubacteriales bacterium]